MSGYLADTFVIPPFMHSPAERGRTARADARVLMTLLKRWKEKLDQKNGVEDLQIRRGWLNRVCAVPLREGLDRADGHVKPRWQQ